MDIPYSQPCDAIALRLYEAILAPPAPPSSTTTDQHEDELFSLIALHLATGDHVNYIESSTGMTILQVLVSTLHFNISRRLQLVYYLLNRHCDPNIANTYNKRTVFHSLLENLRILTQPIIELIYHLITRYCGDINAIDCEGRIPLTYLASNIYLPITPLFITLIELLFEHNPSPYPLQHEPRCIAIPFYVFGNQRYAMKLKFPENAQDFVNSKLSAVESLPVYDSIIQPVSQDPSGGDFNPVITIELSYTPTDHKNLCTAPPAPPRLSKHLQTVAAHDEVVKADLDAYEWKYYKHYLFEVLRGQLQGIHAACVMESMAYPQFYVIENSNPLYREITKGLNGSGSLILSTLAIQPAPIHQLFTMIPKLDVTTVQHVKFTKSTDPQQTAPLSSSSIFSAPLIPPLAMLRCLFLQDNYLFADVHNHIILFLQSHPYLTPAHVSLIKFLLILRKDYNHEVAISHLVQILTTLFQHTFTIPPGQLLKFAEHHFNPTSADPSGNIIPKDIYGIIPALEKDWEMEKVIETRTAPYLDLLQFIFALFEHAYYRDSCDYRNYASTGVGRHTAEHTQAIMEHLLYITCIESNHLHPKQILSLHTFLLYYVPLGNKYCNMKWVLKQFADKIGPDEGEEQSIDDAFQIPTSLTTFVPHTMQWEVLKSTSDTFDIDFDSPISTMTLIDAVFKPLNGAQSTTTFRVISFQYATSDPETNGLSDCSAKQYAIKGKQAHDPAPTQSNNKKKNQKAQKAAAAVVREPTLEELAIAQLEEALTEEVNNSNHLPDAKRAEVLPVPDCINKQCNQLYEKETYTTHFTYPSQGDEVVKDMDISEKSEEALEAVNNSKYGANQRKLLPTFHFGYSEHLLPKIAPTDITELLSLRARMNKRVGIHYCIGALQALISSSRTDCSGYVPLHKRAPVLGSPSLTDSPYMQVFTPYFDIPLLFSLTGDPTILSYLNDINRSYSDAYQSHSVTGNDKLNMLGTLFVFHKHNRDYNQLVTFMNIYAEYYDLTCPLRILLGQIEIERNAYLRAEFDLISPQIDDLHKRVEQSTILSPRTRQALGRKLDLISAPQKIARFVSANFYKILAGGCRLEGWALRPLYTTFKYMFDNTNSLGSNYRFTFYPDDSEGFYFDLLAKAHFHKVTDFDCEQLWDYLRYELGLCPVLTTPMLARQYFSHYSSFCRSNENHEKITSFLTEMFQVWLHEHFDEHTINTFPRNPLKITACAAKITECGSDYDALIDWAVQTRPFRNITSDMLDKKYSNEEQSLIDRFLQNNSWVSPELTEKLLEWGIAMRKAALLLYIVRAENKVNARDNIDLVCHVDILSALNEDMQEFYCKHFDHFSFFNRHLGLESEFTVRNMQKNGNRPPSNYQEYEEQNPSFSTAHSLSLIDRIVHQAGYSNVSPLEPMITDNYFMALIQWVLRSSTIHGWPKDYNNSISLPDGAPIPRIWPDVMEVQNPPSSRFTHLVLQDIFKKYLHLPEAIFQPQSLPQVDTQMINAGRPRALVYSKMEYDDLVTLMYDFLADANANAHGIQVEPFVTIPAVKPLRYYNAKTNEMVYKHPALFPHLDQSLPKSFQNALRFDHKSVTVATSDREFDDVCKQIMLDQNIPVEPRFATSPFPHFESYAAILEAQRFPTPQQALAQSGRQSTIPHWTESNTTPVFRSDTTYPLSPGYQLVIDNYPTLSFLKLAPMLSTTPSMRFKAHIERLYMGYVTANGSNYVQYVQAAIGSMLYSALFAHYPGLPLINTTCAKRTQHNGQFIQACSVVDPNDPSRAGSIYAKCPHCIESNQNSFNSLNSFSKPLNPHHSAERFNLYFEWMVPLFFQNLNNFFPLVRAHGIIAAFAPITSDWTHIENVIAQWRSEGPGGSPLPFAGSPIPTTFWFYPLLNLGEHGSSFEHRDDDDNTQLSPHELATSYLFSSACRYNHHEGAMSLEEARFPSLAHDLNTITAEYTSNPDIVKTSPNKLILTLPYQPVSNEESIQSQSGLVFDFLSGLLTQVAMNALENKPMFDFLPRGFNPPHFRMLSFTSNTPYTPVTKALFSNTSLELKRIDEFVNGTIRMFSPYIPNHSPSTHTLSHRILNIFKQLVPFLTSSDKHNISIEMLKLTGKFYINVNSGTKPSPLPTPYLVQQFAKVNTKIATRLGHFDADNCTLRDILAITSSSYAQHIDGMCDIDIFALNNGYTFALLPTQLSNALLMDTNHYLMQVKSSILQQLVLSSAHAYKAFSLERENRHVTTSTSTPDDYGTVRTTYDTYIASQLATTTLPLTQSMYKQTDFYNVIRDYIAYLFRINASSFTMHESDTFTVFITNLSRLFPIDPNMIDFQKEILVDYIQPILLASTTSDQITSPGGAPRPADLVLTGEDEDIATKTESQHAPDAFYHNPVTISTYVNSPEACNYEDDDIQPAPLLAQPSLHPNRTDENTDLSQPHHFAHFNNPESLRAQITHHVKEAIPKIDTRLSILRCQMAQTLFTHRFPCHDAQKGKSPSVREHQRTTYSSSQYDDSRILPVIALPETHSRIIDLIRSVLLQYLRSPTPSGVQLEFIKWLGEFAQKVLPLELSQISIIYPPNASEESTSNSFATGSYHYSTPYSIKSLFNDSLPSFYQSKLFTSLIKQSTNTPLQRNKTLCTTYSSSFFIRTKWPGHCDILAWLCRSFATHNSFWFSELITFLTNGGTFTSPGQYITAESWTNFIRSIYSNIVKTDGSMSIMNVLPERPTQSKSPHEFYIWQLIRAYHLVNMQPINQFTSPIDALLNHPVVEVALFWKKVYQYALVSTYSIQFSTTDLRHEHTAVEFERYSKKYPKFTLPQIVDALEQLVRTYHDKCEELNRLVDAATVTSYDADGNVIASKFEGNHQVFQTKHSDLFAFVNEYRYFIEVVLPNLDLYPNFAHGASEKIFCICDSLAINSLSVELDTFEMASEKCFFCAYDEMNQIQIGLLKSSRTSREYDQPVAPSSSSNQEQPPQPTTSSYAYKYLEEREPGWQRSPPRPEATSTRGLESTGLQRVPQYILDFIADVLNPADAKSHFFVRHETLTLPPLAPLNVDRTHKRTVGELRGELQALITIDPDTGEVVLNHTLPPHHHDPVEVHFHLPSTITKPSIDQFIPTFTQGMLWHIMFTTHVNYDDVVALLSSPHLTLYNTAVNVNHHNHTILHHAVLLRADGMILQSLWSTLTSPNSHFTTQYDDITYHLLFSKDVFGWMLLDFMQLSQTWTFAPQWTQTILEAYHQYDPSLVLNKYRLNDE